MKYDVNELRKHIKNMQNDIESYEMAIKELRKRIAEYEICIYEELTEMRSGDSKN